MELFIPVKGGYFKVDAAYAEEQEDLQNFPVNVFLPVIRVNDILNKLQLFYHFRRNCRIVPVILLGGYFKVDAAYAEEQEELWNKMRFTQSITGSPVKEA